MKTRSYFLLAVLFVSTPREAASQGTAFTYQGRLQSSGALYTGSAEFQFTLWDAANLGNAVATNNPASIIASVANGLFTVTLDFGALPFNGQPRYLQTEVRTVIGPFTLLAPRQALTPTPYAIAAGNVTSDGISGTYGNAVTFSNAANSFAGNGSGLTSLNASRLASGTVPNARIPAIVARTNEVWLLGGNVGADPTNDFIGTSDNHPLEIRANGRRVLRFEWAGDSTEDFGTEDDGSVNLLGGAPTNSIAPGMVGSVIGGGGASKLTYDTTGGPVSHTAPNRVFGNYNMIGGGAGHTTSNSFSMVGGGEGNSGLGRHSTIAGGAYNTAEGGVSTISGGGDNRIERNADSSTIAGGGQNTIYIGSRSSTIGGGRQNSIRTNANDSTISGGAVNRIYSYIATDKTVTGSTISGGVLNSIEAGADYATIPGGRDNVAGATLTFAAGQQAKALHVGAFVWAGGNTAAYPSTLDNSFNAYAAGGASFDYGGQRPDGRGNRWVYIGPANAGSTLMAWNGARLTDGGVWSNASDEKRKTDFSEINPSDVLEKVAALSVREWRYTNESSGTRHLGPTAQHFKAAFGLGTDEKSIGTLDADGVALAAIQGLNQKLEQAVKEKQVRLELMEKKLAELENLLARLIETH